MSYLIEKYKNFLKEKSNWKEEGFIDIEYVQAIVQAIVVAVVFIVILLAVHFIINTEI